MGFEKVFVNLLWGFIFKMSQDFGMAFWNIIIDTPSVTTLLVSKRKENVVCFFPSFQDSRILLLSLRVSLNNCGALLTIVMIYF